MGGPDIGALESQLPQLQPKAPGGMFGGDGKFGIGQALVAALNGYLASRGNPVGMANIQMMQRAMLERQQRAREDAQYQRKRQDDITDYGTKLQLAAKYTPKEPHYFQNNSGDEYYIGADGNPVEAYHDPLRYKFVPNGMGGVVPVDINALVGGGAPAKPVGKITPIGGATPSASGGFPGGYF
jgi:hypothetical protein